ncbi:hypothetical protein EXN66_Car013498 [Channa argus]|uniref:Uncharacterized protein n=1 Tax=Channa argus TaxID=215402 RepID=A0A6G1Q5N6_CHAAH|nr:hypothetical protein EXN66_Car013498 [Channa argus]
MDHTLPAKVGKYEEHHWPQENHNNDYINHNIGDNSSDIVNTLFEFIIPQNE